jgi:hypothetical protein
MSKNENRIRRWRNVICPESEPDEEIRTIQALEDEIGELGANAERIRALISRIDPLSHYRAFDNVDFLLAAVGDLDYPGNPAIDVLWRHGDIDDERRARAKAYIAALSAWLDRVDLDAAKAAHPEHEDVLEMTYQKLGEINDEKRWLAMSLRKTLKEHTYTPWDVIQEYDDADFVVAVYLSILHRPPSPDDLEFRVEELAQGKTREAFFEEILGAPEHQGGHLHRVADELKHNRPEV